MDPGLHLTRFQLVAGEKLIRMNDLLNNGFPQTLFRFSKGDAKLQLHRISEAAGYADQVIG